MSNRLGGFIAGQNINVSVGTVTFANSPDLTFGSAAGTPAVGQPVEFTTTGTLPTGFSTNTTYYVRSVSSNTCQVSTTQGGSATTYTNGTGSGTHTAVTQRAFNPYAGVTETVEYLVVAGGGGAGSKGEGGSGGGAGGLLTSTGYIVTAGSALTITVGAGGPAGTGGSGVAGTNGTNTVFGAITAIGGGAGCTETTAGTGGSGGGSGGNGAVGLGTAGQGNSGGISSNAVYGYYARGGGGGAGSPGGPGILTGGGWSNNSGGSGGSGLCSTITGQRVFYAGGGGGGTRDGSAQGGFGGAGGGGTAGRKPGIPGTAGTANTGGGGGGGTGNIDGSILANGGAGGSGIVILRYPQINAAPALVTGAPQVSYSDGYQIYTWTSSGSIIF